VGCNLGLREKTLMGRKLTFVMSRVIMTTTGPQEGSASGYRITKQEKTNGSTLFQNNHSES